jgi:ABC-type dipeptide/oligopeptide/nickel transport system ATPase component
MEGGAIVEAGTAEAIVNSPRHPYTRRLLEAARAAWIKADGSYGENGNGLDARDDGDRPEARERSDQ